MRYFRTDRREISYLRFILEGYDGLATMSTVDAREGIVAIIIPETLTDDAEMLLRALAEEISLTEVRMSTVEENLQDA